VNRKSVRLRFAARRLGETVKNEWKFRVRDPLNARVLYRYPMRTTDVHPHGLTDERWAPCPTDG
jgi:hypothetical protein